MVHFCVTSVLILVAIQFPYRGTIWPLELLPTIVSVGVAFCLEMVIFLRFQKRKSLALKNLKNLGFDMIPVEIEGSADLIEEIEKSRGRLGFWRWKKSYGMLSLIGFGGLRSFGELITISLRTSSKTGQQVILVDSRSINPLENEVGRNILNVVKIVNYCRDQMNVRKI